MSVVDKIVAEWAFRCKKGYPDMNNLDDMKILKEIYSEYGIVLEEEKPKEEENYSVDSLIKLLQSRKDELPQSFINKIYYSIQEKGKKLGSIISKEIHAKGLDASEAEIFGLINTVPGLETQLTQVLNTPSKQIKLSDLGTTGNIIAVGKTVTGLPQDFLVSLLSAGRSAKGGKAVGEGEAFLALLGKDGKKLDVGDVGLEGKSIELKGRAGRLGGWDSLEDLYSSLDSLDPNQQQSGRSKSLPVRVSEIIKQHPELSKEVEKLLEKEFNTNFSKIDSAEKLNQELLTWYVNYFLNTEAKNVDYIMIIIGGEYKMFTREEFKEGVESGNIYFDSNFNRSTKYLRIKGFK
jgi:hypothetical protein